MSETSPETAIEAKSEALIEADLKTQVDAARAELITSDFMDQLQVNNKDLYEAIKREYELESNEEGYYIEKKIIANFKQGLDSYLDSLEQEQATIPFKNIFSLIPAEYTFDETHQVNSVKLMGVQPVVLIQKISEEEWELVNFDLTIKKQMYSDAWREAAYTAKTLHTALTTLAKPNFSENNFADPDNPFIYDNQLELDIKLKQNPELGALPSDVTQEFVKKLNDLYRKKSLNQPIPDPVLAGNGAEREVTEPDATPGATPPTAGDVEKPAAAPEKTQKVDPKYVENMRKKVEEIKDFGNTGAETLERNFENALKETDLNAIQTTGDAILTRWKELTQNGEAGVTVAAATDPTDSQPAGAGAESGVTIDSHEAFTGELNRDKSNYYEIADGEDGAKVITMNGPGFDANAVSYSLVQDFLGKEGEAAIGLLDDQLSKTTVTLEQPGKVTRNGQVVDVEGQSAGTEYTWNGDTWVNDAGERLRVYWGTQFSYKTESAEPAAAEGAPTEEPAAGAEGGQSEEIRTLLSELSPTVALHLAALNGKKPDLAKQLANDWAKAIQSGDATNINSAASIIAVQNGAAE